MKWVRLALLLLLMGAVIPRAAHAQASLYGEFSLTDLHNLSSTDILYGGTAGLLYDGPMVLHHVLVSADIQGRFVNKAGGEKLDGLTVGPRFTVPLAHGYAPYGEFMVGFARYNSGLVHGSTTDSTLQLNAGVTKQLTPRLDGVAEYSYAQYYALGGEYNPKTFSVGAVFHFVKR